MKKLMIIVLAAALFVTLRATNPTLEEFTRYYAADSRADEAGFADRLPDSLTPLIEHFEQGDVRQDYVVFSVYNFGGRLYIGAAGDFRPVK